MLRGKGNPRVFSWGNPGTPTTTVPANALLAVGRRSEGGRASRNYVPVHDASTTEPVVSLARIGTAQQSFESFRSLDCDYREQGLNRSFAVAVRDNGDLAGWGQPFLLVGESVGNPRNSIFTRPVHIVAADERAASTQLHKWKKVCVQNRSVIALTEQGKIYGSGAISNLLLDSATATANEASLLVPLSTQTWHDATLFSNGGAIAAIRNDRTLWVRNGPNGFAEYPVSTSEMQVKGFIESLRPSRPWTLSTSTILFLDIDKSPGQTQKLFPSDVAPTSSTDTEVRVRFSPAWGYTAPPTITLTPTALNTTVTYIATLSVDNQWESVDHINRNGLVAVQRAGGTSKVFVHSGNLPYVHASNGTIERDTAKPVGLINVKFSQGVYAAGPSELDDVVSAVGSNGDNQGHVYNTGPQVFCILNSPHSNNSNVIAWGVNAAGQLGIGSTEHTVADTVQLLPSPDTVYFQATSLSASGLHTLAVRTGTDLPGAFDFDCSHLYVCGMKDFSGNTTATANMTTFQPCTGGSVNGTASKWRNVFAFVKREFSFSQNHFLSFASRQTTAEDIVQ